ncbi:DUF4251 domain-containing protein [Chitinophaga nivalis]|uniref:DUF4251 domain-containing protein n=1 Tax=Chitinophaga nivalis TaxID=2991709 RepID=A0ABT3INZ2_9BACT|nr:DUF4251 domain-containing protein [Chitinophaga nivalis]MCW3464619.1 DUF4251 domain-containing protein [Chitinophaga nivalis]MCW3485690.1 DUF4251 domain-containing protein [Chitinophaga nivalis]
MKSSFAFAIVCCFLAATVSPAGLVAQDTKVAKRAAQTARVKSLIDARSYVFVAQTALPMNGRSRQITPDYGITVTTDSIVSYLPYFGRAFVATIGETKSPLDFKTKDFVYTATPGKKDGWEITVKPKDQREIQSLSLSVTSSGYASLQVISTNRTPISFNGYVTETPPEKKKNGR